MSGARHYTPWGRAHRMLARLEEGPASAAELREAASPDGRKAEMWRVVQALREDGLALKDAAGAFVLPPRGQVALSLLRREHTVAVVGGRLVELAA